MRCSYFETASLKVRGEYPQVKERDTNTRRTMSKRLEAIEVVALCFVYMENIRINMRDDFAMYSNFSICIFASTHLFLLPTDNWITRIVVGFGCALWTDW